MVQSFVAMQLPGLVGTDTAHMFPFDAQAFQECKQADLTRVQDVQERFDQSQMIAGLRAGGGLLAGTYRILSVLARDTGHRRSAEAVLPVARWQARFADAPRDVLFQVLPL